jgi:hypothetical protein
MAQKGGDPRNKGVFHLGGAHFGGPYPGSGVPGGLGPGSGGPEGQIWGHLLRITAQKEGSVCRHSLTFCSPEGSGDALCEER